MTCKLFYCKTKMNSHSGEYFVATFEVNRLILLDFWEAREKGGAPLWLKALENQNFTKGARYELGSLHSRGNATVC